MQRAGEALVVMRVSGQKRMGPYAGLIAKKLVDLGEHVDAQAVAGTDRIGNRPYKVDGDPRSAGHPLSCQI
jgi:hypothetical protein